MGDQNRQDEKRERERGKRVRKNTAGPFDSLEIPIMLQYL